MSKNGFRFLDCTCPDVDPVEGSAHPATCGMITTKPDDRQLYRSVRPLSAAMRANIRAVVPPNDTRRRWLHVVQFAKIGDSDRFDVYEVDATGGRDPDWRPGPTWHVRTSGTAGAAA